MAEAFVRHRWVAVIEPKSAGTHPAAIIQPETIACMTEKGITLDGQFPKPLRALNWKNVDLLVNMSGAPVFGLIPKYKGGSLMWNVKDPIGKSPKVYREVRDQIEKLVEGLAHTLQSQVTSHGQSVETAPGR
jgi:protein-tyrosine-phosphatase